MAARPVIKFFTDNNVPESVAEYLEGAGHEVTRLRLVMSTETSDPVIEVACSHSGHVLVTHDKDFRTAAKRLGISRRQYQLTLHKIQLRCREPESARRLAESMSLIEHEWQLVKPDRPMVIEIKDEIIRVLR